MSASRKTTRGEPPKKRAAPRRKRRKIELTPEERFARALEKFQRAADRFELEVDPEPRSQEDTAVWFLTGSVIWVGDLYREAKNKGGRLEPRNIGLPLETCPGLVIKYERPAPSNVTPISSARSAS